MTILCKNITKLLTDSYLSIFMRKNRESCNLFNQGNFLLNFISKCQIKSFMRQKSKCFVIFLVKKLSKFWNQISKIFNCYVTAIKRGGLKMQWKSPKLQIPRKNKFMSFTKKDKLSIKDSQNRTLILMS